MAKTITYSNGMRVVVENIPFLRSVCAGIWVRTGSAMENDENNGISHFVEHVMFKGTTEMSALEIANAFESKGAIINAFTSKENTCYFYKCVDNDNEFCFSKLSEILKDSVFDAKELDSERKVIEEEINMVDDAPEDICYDVLASALYGNHPYAKTILGPKENVRKFVKSDVIEYMKQQYTAESIVVAFAGNVTMEQADVLVRRYLCEFEERHQKSLIGEVEYKPTIKTFIKDFKQANLMLAYPSISISDEGNEIQSLLSVITGGCMGSRLFQQIREKKGLAYSVYSSPARRVNCGSFNVALNINSVNTVGALTATLDEIEKIAESGIADDELTAAKAQLRASIVFGQENVQSIMLSLGKNLSLADSVFDIDQTVEKINSVTKAQINDFARKLFAKKPALAYVGSECGTNFDKILRR